MLYKYLFSSQVKKSYIRPAKLDKISPQFMCIVVHSVFYHVCYVQPHSMENVEYDLFDLYRN
jgi:hypothetical protein